MTDGLFDSDTYIEAWNVADRFGMPPFSVLDTRSGLWRSRRYRWNALGLDSGEGRGDALTFARNKGTDPVSQKLLGVSPTSLFDPVLAELIYRWWSPMDGVILDPFAGGSVRGIVAAMLNRQYHGVDLSQAQVDANRSTADRLTAHVDRAATWYVADSSEWQPAIEVDLVMSCPPYGTLERYSDDPRDLSTMPAEQFVVPYRASIDKAAQRLKTDRFAIFVVSNYRERGRLVDLVGLTIDAFAHAGLEWYGDLILVESGATAGLRAAASFNAGRKPVRIHQYVLVFVKGDWRKAAAAAERVDPLDDEHPLASETSNRKAAS